MTGGKSGARPGVLLTASLCLALIGMALIFVMIAAFSLPVFFSGRGGGVLSTEWSPLSGRYGIGAMVAGTALLSVSAVALAWPLALGFSAFSLTARSGAWRVWAGMLVRLMASVPTVIYGFASLFLLAPLIRRVMGGGTGLGLLTAAPVLALLIFPTMVVVMQAAMRERMAALWPHAGALGLIRIQVMTHFVLPSARRGLAAAAGLGAARAVGDTMISLMLAGNAPQIPSHPADGLRTLTAHMALVTANEVGGAAYDSLFAAGAMVLLLGCGIGTVVRRLARTGMEAGK